MKTKRQHHKRRSKPKLNEFPVLSVILGELLLYLADAPPSSTKANRILVARIMNGVLQVCSGDLKRLNVPLASMPALAKHSPANQAEVEVGKDGAYLYWPRLGVHMGWKELQQIANRLSARKLRKEAGGSKRCNEN